MKKQCEEEEEKKKTQIIIGSNFKYECSMYYLFSHHPCDNQYYLMNCTKIHNHIVCIEEIVRHSLIVHQNHHIDIIYISCRVLTFVSTCVFCHFFVYLGKLLFQLLLLYNNQKRLSTRAGRRGAKISSSQQNLSNTYFLKFFLQ